MNVKPIEERAYELMKEHFDSFTNRLRRLCFELNSKTGDWLDNQTVCQLLHISKRTLQYYRNIGKLPFSTVVGKCYYKIADVEKLLNLPTQKE